MIITADIIRRYPFAVSPRRITDDLQSLIAREMAEAAHKEGQRKALPPTIAQKEDQKAATQRKITEQVLDCLERHGPNHLRAIREIVYRDVVNLQNALAQLLDIGAITATPRKAPGNNASYVYAINPSYSPATGQCDPAQPGNPTGRRFDVTTHAVVAVPLIGPGALNPLPANGGM